MKISAVIGAGFGDEGKGKIVSYLCSQPGNHIVVRLCGGHQAGHHVVLENGLDHVFSNFGSGTLQGVPTVWPFHCTFDPVGFIKEREILIAKGVKPVIYISPNCPVTTPFEKYQNAIDDEKSRHGTCGVGYGRTLKRQDDKHNIKVRDLFHPTALAIKVDLLRDYYEIPKPPKYLMDWITEFIDCCTKVASSNNGIHFAEVPPFQELKIDSLIFEGSQGLLLDQDYGFFPHVTRANTGSANMGAFVNPDDARFFLVTRAYQTRHGNGPMTNTDLPHKIKKNPYEKNYDDGPQGAFRRSWLDIDLLRYAVSSDENLYPNNMTICVTCLDLMEDFALTYRGELINFDSEEGFLDYLRDKVPCKHILTSRVPTPVIDQVGKPKSKASVKCGFKRTPAKNLH